MGTFFQSKRGLLLTKTFITEEGNVATNHQRTQIFQTLIILKLLSIWDTLYVLVYYKLLPTLQGK